MMTREPSKGVTRRHWSSMVLGAGAAAAGLTACVGQAAQPAGPPKIRSGVKLTFMSSSSGADSETKTKYAAQFAEKHAGLTLEHLPITGGGNVALYEKLQSMLAAGTPPDVSYMHPEFLMSYTGKKLLRGLNAFVRRDRYDLGDFYLPASEQYRVDGDLYAMPRGFAMEVLVYNLDLFERAGVKPPPTDWKEATWTLDAFLDTSRRLPAADGSVAGFNAGHLAAGGGAVTSFHRTWVFVYAMGGAVLDPSGQRFLLAEPKAVEGLQYLADLTHRHRVTTEVSGGTAPFNQAKAAMALTGAYGFSGMLAVQGLRWGAAVVPRGPGGRHSSGSGVGWTLPASGANPEEAWLALQHIASKEVQGLEAQLGNVAPARKSVAYSPAFIDPARPPKDARVFADAGDFTHETPRAPGWPEVAEILAEEFAPLWRGERTAKAAIEAIRPRVEPLLRA